uniref:Conjugal transfer protein n=1 Tax=Heterorhabditis bacteriophora TaxID=37862 RepID=A0A1I7XTI6_HETBA
MDMLGPLFLLMFSISYYSVKPFLNPKPFTQKDMDQEVTVMEKQILEDILERERILDTVIRMNINQVLDEEKKIHSLEVPLYQKLIQEVLDEYRYRQSFVPENRPG